MNSNFFAQHQLLFFRWQKKFLENWFDSLSRRNKQLLNNILACQEMTMKSGIELQQLWWDSYFQLIRHIFTSNQPMGKPPINQPSINQPPIDHSRDPDDVRSLIGGALHPSNTQSPKIEVILDSDSNLS